MIEIAAVCDRATVLREGETVGVVDVTAGSEDRIVELMLGQAVEAMGAAGDFVVAWMSRARASVSPAAIERASDCSSAAVRRASSLIWRK